MLGNLIIGLSLFIPNCSNLLLFEGRKEIYTNLSFFMQCSAVVNISGLREYTEINDTQSGNKMNSEN